jgi:hypothetical protein
VDNVLLVNEKEFPGICSGKPYPDLDIDVRDITACLKSGENFILFQAVGDYVVPSGAFLVLEKDSLAEEEQASTGEMSGNPEETDLTSEESGIETSGTEAENATGFEFFSTLVFLTGGKLAADHRKQEIQK